MDRDEDTSRHSGGLHTVHDNAIEESGLLGTHRGWSNISRYEIIFLILGILAAIATVSLTIIRLVDINGMGEADTAYGILILVHSVFLLLFLITGIFQQRITDIVAFFISAVMLTIYVIAHFVARRNNTGSGQSKEATIRLIRLVITIVFNVCFLPLAILVIKDYRRDEFAKRLFGAFPSARRPLKIYNIFDCIARINTMLSISTLLLNLYNFNDFEPIDRIFLIVGIPLAILWLAVGIGMIRLESRILVVFFYLISLFQPGFIGYCLYSAIQNSSETTTTTVSSTITSFTSDVSNMTYMTSEVSTMTSMTSTFLSSTTPAQNLVPVIRVLYVCISTNLLSHILSMIFGVCCIRNFGKGLKERVFNNRFDKWLAKFWSKD